MKRLKHKYFAKPTIHDGIRFDSKKEANVYQNLRLMQQVGDVVFFLRQVPLHLPGDVILRIDFLVFHANGTVQFLDAKGVETETWKAKKRIAESIYPIEIETV